MSNRNELPPGPGRPKGLPNKATQRAREAIGMFVDGNAHRLQEWLDAIASGVDKNGKHTRGPNPEKAFTLFQSVIEYHVPRLQRSTLEGDPDKPMQMNATVNFVSSPSKELVETVHKSYYASDDLDEIK